MSNEFINGEPITPHSNMVTKQLDVAPLNVIKKNIESRSGNRMELHTDGIIPSVNSAQERKGGK